MALTEATINEIKVLITSNKKAEAENILITKAGLSPAEAKIYVDRLADALPDKAEEFVIPKSTNKIAYIMVGFGLLLFGLAIYFFLEKNNQIANSYLTTGVVVGFVVDDGAAPIIDYEIDSASYQYTSNIYAAPPDYELGETVEIYVHNVNPHDIIINSYLNKWLAVTILGIFGAVFLFIGFVLFKVATTNNSTGVSFVDTQIDELDTFDD